jgi:hypothetical protein
MSDGIEFNPNSFDATMSRVIQRLEQGDKTIEDLSKTTRELIRAIGCLPCATHAEQIDVLQENRKRGHSFWDQVKLITISCAVTACLSVGTTLLIVH